MSRKEKIYGPSTIELDSQASRDRACVLQVRPKCKLETLRNNTNSNSWDSGFSKKKKKKASLENGTQTYVIFFFPSYLLFYIDKTLFDDF